MSLRNKVMFITGASRGIGLAIALRAARDGANIAVAAKSDQAHPKLPGTIHSAAAEIEAAGGQALPLVVDVRDEASVVAAVDATVARFGGIDICVNNASAIQLTSTEETTAKRWDLLHQVNARGTFITSRACIPHLRRASNAHVLMISPPLDLRAEWFAPHLPYTIAKYSMSLCVLGLAEELRGAGIAVNALWPRTTIATSAVQYEFGGDETVARSRTPAIMADAAYAIFTRPAAACSGQFFIDDEVVVAAGERDLDRYRVDRRCPLALDLFVREDAPTPPGFRWQAGP